MMKKLLLPYIFTYVTFTIQLILSSPGICSFENTGIGAQALAMGRTFTNFNHTPDAIFFNSSGLAFIDGYQLSLYYTNPFSMIELAQKSCAVALPLRGGVYGVAIKSFGNNVYKENEFFITYANSAFQKLHYGLTLHYSRLEISKYGTDAALGLNLGFQTSINSLLNWGFYVINVNKPHIGKQKEDLPTIFSTGLNIRPAKSVNVNFDLYKDVKFPVEIRIGFEYLLLERLALRGGIVTEPASFTAGIGINLSFMNLDYAFDTHTVLGYTHHFSVNFSYKKTVKDLEKISPGEVYSEIKTININAASIEELQSIKGIGPIIARRIYQYRGENGPFKNIEQLKKVKGIGEKFFNKIKEFITIE